MKASGPADDAQELRQDIEQTREQLGETVEQLVAKADVKARARDQAANLVGRVKGQASQIRTQTAVRARQGATSWPARPEGRVSQPCCGTPRPAISLPLG